MRASQGLFDSAHQDRARKRLIYVLVEPAGKKTLARVFACVGRAGDRRRRVVGRHPAQQPEEVHAGAWLAQVDVQQKQIEALAGGHLKRVFDGIDELEVEAGTEQMAKKPLDRPVVLDDEDTRAYTYGRCS